MDPAMTGQLDFALHDYDRARDGRSVSLIGTDRCSFERPDLDVPDYIPPVVRVSMPILAVVEILPQPDGELPRELLWKSYSASRAGTVVLALNGITVAAVNRVLDAIVPCFPLSIPGILYVDAANEPLLGWILARAPLIFGWTGRLRALAPRATLVINPAMVNSFRFGRHAAAAD